MQSVKKGFNRVAEYEQIIKRIHSHGIALQAGIIVGFDHEPPEIFRETKESEKWVCMGAYTPKTNQTATPVSPSLRNYAELQGIRFGTYFSGQGFADPAWQAIAAREFDLANLFYGFSWREFEPKQGEFDFSAIDPQVAFAHQPKMEVCGHTLFWPVDQDTYPEWVRKGHFTHEQITPLLKNYITTVMKHYTGQINCWIVVEEPYNPPVRNWDLLYTAFGGYSYLDFLYQTAREADPKALLLYNDGDNHFALGENTALTIETVQRLAKGGLLDGVGLEMHLDARQRPDKQAVLDTMKSYNLPIHVTEIDVNLAGIKGSKEERFGLQAEIYADMLSACLESGQCASFSLWGFGDKYSWLERQWSDADATLFDENLQPKPAYEALLEVLKP